MNQTRTTLGAILIGASIAAFQVQPAIGILGVLFGAGLILFRRRSKPREAAHDDLAELALLPEEKNALRLEIFETNYGRTSDWYAELNGKRLALLTEPQYEDMFWVSYKVESLPDAYTEGPGPDSPAFWEDGGLVFRSVRFSLVAKYAFAALGEPYKNGRVHMRGLYITIPEPSDREKIELARRRKIHAKSFLSG